MGSFVEFCRQIFGMLEFAGATSGLGNLDRLRAQQDDEHIEWSAFFEAWHALLGDSAVSSRDLAAINLDDNRLGWFEQFSSAATTVFRESLPPDLEPTTDKERCEFSRKLGYALRARCDRIFGKIRLVRGVAAGSSHGNSVQWQVVLVAQSRARTYPRANNAKTSPALPATSPGQTQNDTSEPLVVPVDEASIAGSITSSRA
jgi:hypothetical protein